MENRRQTYRLAIDETQRLTARFQSPDDEASFSVDIVNLSIGGMCAIPEPKGPALDGRWLVEFSLNSRKLQMLVERVYADGERPGHCGFRFLPAADPDVREEQEATIWKFLLQKQREERRQAREAGKLTG